MRGGSSGIIVVWMRKWVTTGFEGGKLSSQESRKKE